MPAGMAAAGAATAETGALLAPPPQAVSDAMMAMLMHSIAFALEEDFAVLLCLRVTMKGPGWIIGKLECFSTLKATFLTDPFTSFLFQDQVLPLWR
jgi:hypothetical protein